MTREMARCGLGTAGVFGWGVLLTLLLRTLASFLGSLPLGALDAGAEEVRLWLADRDGDAIFGLDRNLHVRSMRAVRKPVGVCVSGEAMWVLSAEEGYATGGQALLRFDESDAVMRIALPSGEAQLAAVRHGAVLCLQRLEGTTINVLTLFEQDGGSKELMRDRAERSRLHSDGGLKALVSLAQNRLGVLHLPESETGSPRFEVLELPRGPEGFEPTRLADACASAGGWLTLEEDGVLRHLSADGTQLWSTRSAECWGQKFEAPKLIVAHDKIWLHSRRRAWIERRSLRTGRRMGRAFAGLPHGVVDLAVPWVEGGVLFAAGGALLHLDRTGKIAPGQGGFRFVSGLALSCSYEGPIP